MQQLRSKTIQDVTVLICCYEDKTRGDKWYLEKRGSRKTLAGSHNLERLLISLEVSFLHGLFLLFFRLKTFYQSLGLGFLTRISDHEGVHVFLCYSSLIVSLC